MEEAEIALSLLRVFQGEMIIPQRVSYIVPLGREHKLGKEFLFERDGLFAGTMSSADGSAEFWIITEKEYKLLLDGGLAEVDRIYNLEKRSKFQEELLKLINVLSRSSLQKSTEERLIFVFRALDSFLLASQSESIVTNVAERISFTLASAAAERKRISKIIKDAYGFRSSAIHHNKSIAELEKVQEFLEIVVTFLIELIRRNEDFETVEQLFEEVELKKFG